MVFLWATVTNAIEYFCEKGQTKVDTFPCEGRLPTTLFINEDNNMGDLNLGLR